ncbi:alpha-L-fucosidase [Agreia sp. Leaf283]|uniref:alpha-L-fucosidase n=1 Tax=Agreia sp. Leaf283 TaxID=1736321 RepID=UPI0006F839C5|nr:alpha-L-fucosidase [Agreia sp. Leaf283]KQP53737.1 alpha-L-fucosidase [Agreia sp. Leaf283]
MAMFTDGATRPADYEKFVTPTPQWYSDAKLGIFVHWGPFSVPAWAEPIGALGTIEKEHWFRHNPYAEWYYNTIRIEGSPAQQHQLETYGGAPYDDFIDTWTAEKFDADAVLALVASTGARYFVPTTKHHDGVTLWDAPGTGDRNTVHRGPKRDLVAEFQRATLDAGLRFGVYYSGGLDWFFGKNPPIVRDDMPRPVDQAYADYAFDHVSDLIAKYTPDVLWGDIEWPDAGKTPGPKSLITMFEQFYAAAPDGVVNDRWGETHWDFRTSEYEQGLGVEAESTWENCRGIGYSFGYNRLEDESNSLDGAAAIHHFVDVVSRGGNLLLNIGLTGEGLVPELQRRTLEQLGAWNEVNGSSIFDSRPLDPSIATASDEPWVRWTRTGDTAHAFVETTEPTVLLQLDASRLVASSARTASGEPVSVSEGDGGIVASLPAATIAGPVQLTFDIV